MGDFHIKEIEGSKEAGFSGICRAIEVIEIPEDVSFDRRQDTEEEMGVAKKGCTFGEWLWNGFVCPQAVAKKSCSYGEWQANNGVCPQAVAKKSCSYGEWQANN